MADTVIPIKDDLVRIRVDSLEVAEFAAEAEDNFAFSNPRHFAGARPGIDGKGFDRSSMGELRESIVDTGLQNPLIVRTIGEGDEICHQLIAGERRLRCVRKIKDEDIECYDRENKDYKPGGEVYEYVECRLYPDLSDRDAMKLAFQENSTAVGIGEAANYNWFCYVRKSGFTDEEILDLTKKTESWIRAMDKISTLDEHCLDRYKEGRINQTVAGLLADVGEAELRVQLCDETCGFAHDRVKDEIDKREQALKGAREGAERAKAGLVIAKHRDDEEEEKEAGEAVAAATEEVTKKKKALDDSRKSEKAKQKDFVDASKKVTGKRPKKAVTTLRAPKIEKFFIEPALAMIDADGFDGDDKVGEPRDLKLVTLIATAIVEGETDLKQIMDSFYEEIGDEDEADAGNQAEEEYAADYEDDGDDEAYDGDDEAAYEDEEYDEDDE
tara:strand:+ start:1000 stop:2325 length:1326 start_codon:yes stop_codon:yes gene_type:complete